jgi:hypothetical protein
METSLSHGYRPELDFSVELDRIQTTNYQALIGILQWIVELSCIDIIVPMTLLSW